MQLIKSVSIASCVTPTAGAAGTSAITGSVLDLSQAEGALILVRFGAITSGAVTSIKFQHGDASDLSDAADVTGTSQTIADTDDEKIFYIDISKPTKRYGRLYVSRATQNAVVSSAVAVIYGERSQPVTQPSGVSGEAFASAVSGTA